MTTSRFERAIACFDEENARDPRQEVVEGVARPRELVYAERMSAQLDAFCPDASETLRLPARCQHIRRWEIPRSDFPMDRIGYRRWRSALSARHAEVAGQILCEVGYDEAVQARVADLLQKRRLKKDAEAQMLEDVVCLVFLEHYFDAFSRDHSREKLVDILRKTWAKMSDRGRDAALRLPLSPKHVDLVTDATR